ncbi:hypothetical protein ACFW7J_06755 [Streptomyces sp. NPDC059525]|uniref:hypothetical protein n=1 Tax=Streptomyces sp. NPDC059525 TaxID=3346857 RepID=UPI00367CB503
MVLESASERLVLGADVLGDVVGGAFVGEVLLAEPVLVDGVGAPGAVDGQAGRTGLFEDDVPGQAGLLRDVGERLSLPGVFVLQELGREDRAGLLAQPPGSQWRVPARPFLRLGAYVLEREADVRDGHAQVLGGLSGGALFGEHKAPEGVQIDVGERWARQCQTGSALVGRFPGEGFGDAQPFEEPTGVLVQGMALVEGEGGQEGEVAAAVAGRLPGQGVRGVSAYSGMCSRKYGRTDSVADLVMGRWSGSEEDPDS